MNNEPMDSGKPLPDVCGAYEDKRHRFIIPVEWEYTYANSAYTSAQTGRELAIKRAIKLGCACGKERTR